MQKWKKVVLKTLLAVTLTTGSIYLFAPWEYVLYYLKPLPSSVTKEVESAANQHIDGIIVYAHKGGEKPRFYAGGWHDRDKKIPAYSDALFKIASIAKLYDASAVAKLAAVGLLDLEKSLADYFPDLKSRIQYADEITLRMMVQHRSGIPNFTDQEGFDWGSSSLDVMSLLMDKPADFKPGTDYAYSNSNYLLLQKIMTKQLGYPYTQYIKQDMLAPLGINQTYFSVNEVDQQRLMSGYHVGFDQDFKSLDQGYVATIHDVGVFLRALNDGALFTDEEAEIYSNLYEYNHTGWVLGHSSIARYHPEIDTVLIQLTSTTGDDTVMLTSIIYNRILDILKQDPNSHSRSQ